VTKLVDSVIEGLPSPTGEELDTLDPTQPKGSKITRNPDHRHMVVFIVGGGNYLEYQNLMEYCRVTH
jgi:hypothetical protein